MSLFHFLLVAVVFWAGPSFAETAQKTDYTTITIRPVNPSYPVEAWQKDPRFKVKIAKRQSPWYETKVSECSRIFAAGRMQSKITNWDGLSRNLFLQRLDHKGARGIASVYPQFQLSQLQSAEAELRRVKALP